MKLNFPRHEPDRSWSVFLIVEIESKKKHKKVI